MLQPSGPAARSASGSTPPTGGRKDENLDTDDLARCRARRGADLVCAAVAGGTERTDTLDRGAHDLGRRARDVRRDLRRLARDGREVPSADGVGANGAAGARDPKIGRA